MMLAPIACRHAIIFLAAAGYTLFHDGLVRIDIIYEPALVARIIAQIP